MLLTTLPIKEMIRWIEEKLMDETLFEWFLFTYVVYIVFQICALERGQKVLHRGIMGIIIINFLSIMSICMEDVCGVSFCHRCWDQIVPTRIVQPVITYMAGNS